METVFNSLIFTVAAGVIAFNFSVFMASLTHAATNQCSVLETMRQVRFVSMAACGTALNIFISSMTHVLCDSGAGFSSLFFALGACDVTLNFGALVTSLRHIATI